MQVGDSSGTGPSDQRSMLWKYVEDAATRRSTLAISWYNDRVKPKVPMDHSAAWFHPVKRAKINKVEGFQSAKDFKESFQDLLIKPCILACLALLETVTIMLSVATFIAKLVGGILTRELTLKDLQEPALDALEAFAFHFVLDALFIMEVVLQLGSFLMKAALYFSSSAREKLQTFNQQVDEERGEVYVENEVKSVYDYLPTALQFGG
jgi:hypothetical protein